MGLNIARWSDWITSWDQPGSVPMARFGGVNGLQEYGLCQVQAPGRIGPGLGEGCRGG